MVVTTGMIDADTPYSLGTIKDRISRTYTQDMFGRALDKAMERFTRENPGLGPSESDEAVEYLVAHYLYLAFEGAEDTTSGSATSMSFQRLLDKDTGEVVTFFLAAYKAKITLKGSRAILPSAGVRAADAYTSRAMHPTNQAIPRMDYDDNDLAQPEPSDNGPAGVGPNPLYP